MNQNPTTPKQEVRSAEDRAIRVLNEYTEATICVADGEAAICPTSASAAGGTEVGGPTSKGDGRPTPVDTSYADAEHRRRYPGPYSSSEPTPYQKSGLVELAEELGAVPDGTDELFNARDPHYAIMHERPEHRVIIYLKAQGHSNREIADITGFTPVAISNIVRQPWARKRITEIITSNGGNAVETLLQGEALASVERLVTERDNMLARSAERTAAANSLLDRLFGKPSQPIRHSVGHLDSLSDEDLARIATGSTTVTATT